MLGLASVSSGVMPPFFFRAELSDVSTHGTDLDKLIREDFWLIVTIME
jgi:hypothetical protein